MNTLGVAYIICGILYTIACVMDGQDVKPRWKKWVGKRLEKASNYFFPINYIIDTKYIPVAPQPPFERCDYNVTKFESRKIESAIRITESDMLEYKRYGRNGINLDFVIERYKKDCMSGIFNTIRYENLVNFDVDRTSYAPNIIVRAWMYVGKKR